METTYEDSRMVFATVTATGVPGQWTQPGLFQAYKKVADETMVVPSQRTDPTIITWKAWSGRCILTRRVPCTEPIGTTGSACRFDSS